MNKNRENFKKYSNDLYFHHLLVENERIRTLICQELILDREIVSTKLKNAQQYHINQRDIFQHVPITSRKPVKPDSKGFPGFFAFWGSSRILANPGAS